MWQACRDRPDKAASGGGLILSFGGGVSPGTPPENVDALIKTAREWIPSTRAES